MAIETFNVGAADIAYELTGPAGAPVVVLSHCFSSDHRFWDPHFDACAGFRVLRYDTRGHGASSRPPGPYTLDQLAGDIVALLAGLAIDKVHFAGVSMGGMIAQTVAIQYPEKLLSLALINTTPDYDDARREGWRERAAMVQRDGIEAVHADLMQRWFTDAAIANDAPGYRYMADALRRFAPESFGALAAAISEVDTTRRLREIKVPTLVVAAPEDPGVPPELSRLLADEIAGAELHWLEPARHLATLEHPAVFNDLLRRHLQRAHTEGTKQ